MRYITIERVEPGMILARSVFDEGNCVLLGAANVLTKDYIKKLTIRGFQGLYIDDEISKGINVEETISVELRNRGVKSLRECNIDESLEVARCIVDQIIDSKSISLDLVDLRTFDDYTYRHSVNVAVLCTVIGLGMSLKEKDLVDLCAAAIFHDLGKLQIPSEILNKPAKLTAEEYEVMKDHPILSYNLLKGRWDVSARTKVGVLYHHENEDGSGYPSGLHSHQILLFAKIIHVADVYDALTAKRPYKKPYALSEAAEYLMAGYGVKFNKEVVDAFLKHVPIYPKGMGVVLSDGRRGIVVENTKHTLRPIVRLMDGTELNLNDGMRYSNITLQADVDELEVCFN
ncbi:MAG: HD-GYP domain-containing protein [Velocimicrobium sp.]